MRQYRAFSLSCPPAPGLSLQRSTDMLRAVLTRSDPKEFLFFNRNSAGQAAARAFIARLKERGFDRDAAFSLRAFRAQLAAIKRWAHGTKDDLSKITPPTLIVNGDNDRMVPTPLSRDLARRISGSELIIYPDAGHGSIFQYPEQFAAAAVRFLTIAGTHRTLTRRRS